MTSPEGRGAGTEEGEGIRSVVDRGLVPHAARKITQRAIRPSPGTDIHRFDRHLGYSVDMWILLLEALGALALLVFIVWWTMFSGRRRGEPPHQDTPKDR